MAEQQRAWIQRTPNVQSSLLIRNDLAQKYIAYLLWIDQTSGYIHAEAKQQMLKSVEKQKYREAVGIYLLAQIVENGRR
jgi:hypothetical protein